MGGVVVTGKTANLFLQKKKDDGGKGNGGNCVREERGMMQQVIPEGQEAIR